MALRGFKKRLVDNSIDAYVLSLETINRLSVEYRLESFCILLCNAWELLLKARIAQVHGRQAIYYSRKKGESLRTLSGKDCSQRVFPNQQLDVRMNLEKVIDLRDECTHLVIAKVPSDILELLQSCVLNYHKCLVEWFGISLSDRVPVGMMTIVFEIAPLTSDITLLRKSLGAEEIKFLAKFQAEIIRKVKSMIPQEWSFNAYSFQAVCHVLGVKNRSDWYFRLGLQGARGQFSQALATEIVQRINEDSSFIRESRSAYSSWKRTQGHFERKQQSR